MEPLWSPVVATSGRGRFKGVVAVREWRTSGAHPSICRVLLSSLGYANRRSLRLERECHVPAQPVFDLCDRHELQSTAPNPTQLRTDVFVEEIPAAAQRLCCLVWRQG